MKIAGEIVGVTVGGVVAVMIGAEPWHALHMAIGVAAGVWAERYLL